MHLTFMMTIVALAALATALPHPQITDQMMGTGMAIALDNHTWFLHANKSVNLDAVHSHAASVDSKICRGFENYEKNTGMIHPFAVKEVGKRQSSLPLFNAGAIWYGTIVVGFPPQIFRVAFDTAFGDLIIPHTRCLQSCNGHDRWNPKNSMIPHYVKGPIDIKLFDGAIVTASVYADVVYISNLSVYTQTFGVATHYPPSLESSAFYPDGIMGMAFQSISAIDAKPVIQNLIYRGRLTSPVFSVKLSFIGAELYIGGVNPALFVGPFTYVPVTVQAFWQVNMDSVLVNNRMVAETVPAIIHIGTDLITGPPKQVRALYAALDGIAIDVGDGFYALPCDFFPVVTLTFGGRSFQIPPAFLIVGPLPDGLPLCLSAIVGSERHPSFWVVGGRFLYTVYTTFDFSNDGNPRVGFASLA